MIASSPTVMELTRLILQDFELDADGVAELFRLELARMVMDA